MNVENPGFDPERRGDNPREDRTSPEYEPQETSHVLGESVVGPPDSSRRAADRPADDLGPPRPLPKPEAMAADQAPPGEAPEEAEAEEDEGEVQIEILPKPPEGASLQEVAEFYGADTSQENITRLTLLSLGAIVRAEYYQTYAFDDNQGLKITKYPEDEGAILEFVPSAGDQRYQDAPDDPDLRTRFALDFLNGIQDYFTLTEAHKLEHPDHLRATTNPTFAKFLKTHYGFDAEDLGHTVAVRGDYDVVRSKVFSAETQEARIRLRERLEPTDREDPGAPERTAPTPEPEPADRVQPEPSPERSAEVSDASRLRAVAEQNGLELPPNRIRRALELADKAKSRDDGQYLYHFRHPLGLEFSVAEEGEIIGIDFTPLNYHLAPDSKMLRREFALNLINSLQDAFLLMESGVLQKFGGIEVSTNPTMANFMVEHYGCEIVGEDSTKIKASYNTLRDHIFSDATRQAEAHLTEVLSVYYQQFYPGFSE